MIYDQIRTFTFGIYRFDVSNYYDFDSSQVSKIRIDAHEYLRRNWCWRGTLLEDIGYQAKATFISEVTRILSVIRDGN